MFTVPLTFLLVMKIEYAIPWAIFATIFLTIGSGLYSLLQPGSPTGQWVGFQIIAGIGSGAGIQVVCNFTISFKYDLLLLTNSCK